MVNVTDRSINEGVYFVWNGRRSTDYDIRIHRYPDIICAEKRVQAITIPGRNGTLYIDDDVYEGIEKSVECYIRSAEQINEISAWLRGRGNVIFGNERDKYYRAVIVSPISFGRFAGSVREFSVTFLCEPFKYSVNAESDFISTTEREIQFYGKGTFRAEPIITFYGGGDISVVINGKAIQLNDVSEYITLNSEIMDAYKGNENQNMKMIGEFPALNAENGLNTLSISGNITRIDISPNWRWL